jgi:cytochrome P450
MALPPTAQQQPPDFDTADYFTEPALMTDPYPYFEHLRSKHPVTPTGHHRVVAITGYDEAAIVYRDNENFSACNAVAGPFTRFTVPLEGDDLTEVIASNRDQVFQNDLLATMDPPLHTQQRGLMMRLITPKRLAENEEFMWRLADEQIDRFIERGRCEFVREYSKPFSMLVIADLLGVPREHFDIFMTGFNMAPDTAGGFPATPTQPDELNTLNWLYDYFATYVEERRREPKQDYLTELAKARYDDDSVPDVMAVVHLAAFLFAAGQETTSHLLGSAMKYLAEFPELQERLRTERKLIPIFVEECLRLSTPIKTNFRLALRRTQVAGVDIEPGAPVVILNGAVSRDPNRFDLPDELNIDRPNAREHIAFGRGIHTCPGGPLARTEARITVERALSRMQNIRFAPEHHGSHLDRHFDYEASWMIRGLHDLHLEFDAVPAHEVQTGATGMR